MHRSRAWRLEAGERPDATCFCDDLVVTDTYKGDLLGSLIVYARCDSCGAEWWAEAQT